MGNLLLSNHNDYPREYFILVLTEARFSVLGHSFHPWIRPARIEDLSELLRLEALFPCDRLSRRSFLHLLQYGHADLLVLENTNELLGNVVVLYRRHTTMARLYSIVVACAARGHGLGRALLDAGEFAARDYGRVSMVLEVREDNDGARALYQRTGYHLLERFPAYYEDGADALRFHKCLLTHLTE